MNVFTSLNLNLNKLLQARLDPLYSDPSLNELASGRLWFNQQEKVFKYFDGEKIIPLAIEGLDERITLLEENKADKSELIDLKVEADQSNPTKGILTVYKKY